MKARQLLKKGERALIIFTRGKYFESKVNGTGETSYWTPDPKHEFDFVIIYHRNQIKKTNEIYTGVCTKTVFDESEDGYKLYLDNLQLRGQSDFNWKKFADTGSNPIRYLSK